MAFVAFDSALSRLGCSILTSDIARECNPGRGRRCAGQSFGSPAWASACCMRAMAASAAARLGTTAGCRPFR